ncbi:MAG: alpha/beta hydrolase [Breznakiellaceae bacterium]
MLGYVKTTWPVPEIYLWEKGPSSCGVFSHELVDEIVEERSADPVVCQDRSIRKVCYPSVFPMIAPKPLPLSVLVIPGGGYERVVIDKEGFEIGSWLNSVGITAFVLKYRLPEAPHGQDHGIPLQDAQRAMTLIREQGASWGWPEGKVAVMGFSAGGHLAAELCTRWDTQVPAGIAEYIDAEKCRPDLGLLMYPVVSMQAGVTHQGSRSRLLGSQPSPELVELHSAELQVRQDMPPLFMVHALDDGAVPVTNTLRLCEVCSKRGIPVEAHIFPDGGHGFGLREKSGTIASWPDLAVHWLTIQGGLK